MPNKSLYIKLLESPFYNVLMGIKHPIILVKYLKFRLFSSKPNVINLEETLKEIKNKNLSVSRFGDGELKWLLNENSYKFQHGSRKLAQRLENVLTSDDATNLAIAIPDVFNGLNSYMPQNKNAWMELLASYYNSWQPYLKQQNKFYDANMSRFYIDRRDKEKTSYYFDLLKQIWQDRDVLVVEGSGTRLGVGNDLLSNAKSVKRILAPVTNAFDVYDDILLEIRKNVDTETLILLALGPTATVMAYDLSKLGYQAIDIGHADLEYEWFKLGVTQRVSLENRYVNEVDGGNKFSKNDLPKDQYEQQIIATIGEK